MDNEDVIVLSSSDDESEIIKSVNSSKTILKFNESKESNFSESVFPKVNFNETYSDNSNKDILKVNEYNESNFSDLEFPRVNFNDIHSDNSNEDFLKVNESKESSDLEFPKVNFNDIHNGNNLSSNKIDEKDLSNTSSSDVESQSNAVDYWNQYLEGLRNCDNIDLSSDEENNLEEPVEEDKEQNNKQKGVLTRKDGKCKTEAAQEKKKKQDERKQAKLKKQEEAAKQKALKQLNSKNRLRFNVENSLKSMEIMIDKKIENFDFFTDFLRGAEETEVKYKLHSQIIPTSITWNRTIETHYMNERHEVCSNMEVICENQIMIIWDAEEAVNHISNNTLYSTISSFKSMESDKKFTLVIYKIESYFKYIKSTKNCAVREDSSSQGRANDKKSKTKLDKTFVNYPKISRKKFEECLVEIQLLHNVNSRLIDTPSELVLLIHQYTKSLALRPSKMEKQESSQDWYVSCDNRDTVKVDKDGNGLKRLWQQQLCQFHLMSLEMSEAIVSVYKSPMELIEAYANCSQTEGESLLKDIVIRRTAGPITSRRKIGPELSKRIYTMFTAEDGNIFLNE